MPFPKFKKPYSIIKTLITNFALLTKYISRLFGCKYKYMDSKLSKSDISQFFPVFAIIPIKGAIQNVYRCLHFIMLLIFGKILRICEEGH